MAKTPEFRGEPLAELGDFSGVVQKLVRKLSATRQSFSVRSDGGNPNPMGSGIRTFLGLGVTSQRLCVGHGLVGDARADDLAEAEEGRVGDTVEDLNALPATRNEGGVVQGLEMTGDVGLAGAGGSDDVVHR